MPGKHICPQYKQRVWDKRMIDSEAMNIFDLFSQDYNRLRAADSLHYLSWSEIGVNPNGLGVATPKF